MSAAHESIPLPLARCHRRHRNALEVRERHDLAYYLFEIYLKYLASVAIAHYLAGEARAHREVVAFSGHQGPVSSAVFSPDGARVVTSSSDSTARLWEANGELRTTFRGHEGPVLWAEFSPDGRRILTASRDKTARLWDLEGNEQAVLRGHGGIVWGASFSPDGDRVVTASWDGTARLWLADPEELLRLAEKRAFRDFTPRERNRYAALLG